MNVSAEHRYTLTLLLALTGTSAFSLQFFVPAMPDLVQIFETTPAMVQLTLTLFMLTYGIFQAVYGPLSDRFGRKPVLLVAIVIYVAGSFLGVAALSIEMVIAARVLQAVGAAAGFVLVPAIARDVYGQGGAPRAMSYISMTNGFISAAGPLIGGLIHQYAGWRYGLLATGTLGASMLVMTTLYLKESGCCAPAGGVGADPARVCGACEGSGVHGLRPRGGVGERGVLRIPGGRGVCCD
jgi:MFS transporter, DHA1 family, multidrug resistance protein